jgi:phosphopantetheinyl transferase (holo-ACP synthase)
MAMHVAVQELFAILVSPRRASRFEPQDVYLRYTALGGPKIVLRSPANALLSESGHAPGDLHVSFTHDGGAHQSIVACGRGVKGLGIDMVHLPRLFRTDKDKKYLARLAASFMSSDELALFLESALQDSTREFATRTAAHFSLMEAASKALGTGLKIGGGMGKPESLPKRSIEVLRIDPEVEFHLNPEASERCKALRASRLAGYWSADDEFLVSVAMLW